MSPIRNTVDGNQRVRHSPDAMEPFHYVPGILWAESPAAADSLLGLIVAAGGFPAGAVEETQPDDQREYRMFKFPAGRAAGPPEAPAQLDAVVEVLAQIVPDHELWNRVWPEYVGWPMQHTNVYPAAPAEPAGRPAAPPVPSPGSTTCHVVLVDIGFEPELWGQGGPRPDGLPPRDLVPPTNQPLSPAVCHGEAVAWIVQEHAPHARVSGVSLAALGVAGAAAILASPRLPAYTVSALVKGMHEGALQEPDVLVITSGVHVKEGNEPKNLTDTLDNLTARMYVVASAGESLAGGGAVLTYPAAHPLVVGVGAKAQAGGGWAPYSAPGDAWAVGQHVVGFLEGTFPVDPVGHNGMGGPIGDRAFAGGATVTGTSFAAPVVAAAIARVGAFDARTSAITQVAAQAGGGGDFGVGQP